MKLGEYMNRMIELVRENPGAADYEVVSSIDDEGNGFNPVYYGPSPGYFDGNAFIDESSFEEYNEDYDTTYEVNAVCIN